jgi:hypothetical protein
MSSPLDNIKDNIEDNIRKKRSEFDLTTLPQIIPPPLGVPPMNQKLARQIHRSVRLLEACGYECSPVQLGTFNVLAVSPIDLAVVQVRNPAARWPPFPREVAEMQQYTVPGNVKKIVHRWSKRKLLPDVLVI